LARIIAPSDLDRAYEIKSLGADKTYGITSDPLTQFSCVFSAVIHDVDHPGVPNTTLVEEKTPLATKYNNKSIAEQNSVDLAWNLLMNDRYKTLRSAIYSSDVEMRRFRQLVVNSVMATDIADKDQKVFRNARWDRAFHESVEENEQDSINRKATIVIEHLIQASDVSHTMQHVRVISIFVRARLPSPFPYYILTDIL
jgi:3'5'-cyclic nucleotide phosphodiesterase